MKYLIKTFGCQMNYSDSERIASLLKEYKLKPASLIKEAGLVVFNTCGVRQSAEDRVYGQIHNLKKTYPDMKIILTGCLANRPDVKRRLKNKVNLFTEIKNFPQDIKTILISPPKTNPPWADNIQCNSDNQYFHIKPIYQSTFSAHIPIMTGCNNFCAYCVVPYARGREKSREAEEIIKEIKSLVKNGYKEIILLGQNVNSYCSLINASPTATQFGGQAKINKSINKKSKYKTINFSDLLKMVNDIPGEFWIRFLTSHPKDMSDELIDIIAKSKKVCEYVHLPIQAGDNEVLKNMNRRYTQEHYLKLIAKIRKAFKKYKPQTLYAITTDIIVGFPKETEAQFKNSAEVMKKVQYDMAYLARFSPRPQTAAFSMKDNVTLAQKKKREKTLQKILEKTALKNNQKYLNKTVTILVEKQKKEASKTSSAYYTYFGKTRTLKNVKFKSQKDNLVGKFVKIKIIKANTWNLSGSLRITNKQ